MVQRYREDKRLSAAQRLAQDGQKNHNLEPQWGGPYRLVKVSENGRSGLLKPLHSNEDLGKWHLNDLKIFVPRINRKCSARVLQMKAPITLLGIRQG